MMFSDGWVMYCKKGESQMNFRRNRALIVGHIGFDYFIVEDDLTFHEKINPKTKEDFENYINNNNLKPFLGGTAGNVCAVMREIGSLEVDRFSCGDSEGLLKYDELSPDLQHDINKNIICSDPYLTVPICLIFSKNEKQTTYIYDRTLDCYNHIQEFNIPEWGSDGQYELIHVTTLPPNAALKLFKECKEKTPESILSFCPGQNLGLYHPPVLFEILSLVDILFVLIYEVNILASAPFQRFKHHFLAIVFPEFQQIFFISRNQTVGFNFRGQFLKVEFINKCMAHGESIV